MKDILLKIRNEQKGEKKLKRIENDDRGIPFKSIHNRKIMKLQKRAVCEVFFFFFFSLRIT